MSEAEIIDLLRRNRETVEAGFQEFRGDLAGFRDELRVQSAIIQRMDGTLIRVLEELRAMRAQQMRFEERLRRLEDASPSGPA
jgi:hypothetical protein